MNSNNISEIISEKELRPKYFKDFNGQDHIKRNFTIFIEAAKKRKEAMDHVLLYGAPGLGKTTLAYIIANELNSNIKISSGPVLDKPSNLAGILTNLEFRDVLFIDEIHRLSPLVEEYLYSAMEDYKIDILVESGVNARSVQIKLEPFTLIGSTTRSGLLTAPMRSRFGITSRLEYYNKESLTMIIKINAKKLFININDIAAQEIAIRSRGTPRIANSLLRRIRDFAQVEKKNSIDIDITEKCLKSLNVDNYGLNEMDHKILITIINKFKGGPVGLNNIAISVNETPNTIEEVYEPFLIQEGYLIRTLRGRKATLLAYEILKINKNKK